MCNSLKQKLYDVISGKSEVRFGNIIQAAASYLNEGSRTSTTTE